MATVTVLGKFETVRERARALRESSKHRLTASAIESFKPGPRRYEITDLGCAGLQLRIETTRAKSWIFRYYWQHRRQRIVLGAWPDVGLAQARELVTAARILLKRGIDPRTAGLAPQGTRRPGRASTEVVAFRGPPTDEHSIEFLASEYMTRHVIPHRKRPEQVQRMLDREILPKWRGRDARTIKPREVIELLDGIVARGVKVQANRIAGVLGQMFRFGIHRALLETTPVQLLYRPGGREKPRRRVLSDEELMAFLLNRKLACRFERSSRVLMLLLLTLQRRGELAVAEWREINFEKATWTIPDEHTKTGQGHIVPLSTWALEELKELKRAAGNSRFVLPNEDGTAADDPKYITRSVARLQRRFRAIGLEKFTAHDLRRTGRTGLARLGVATEIAERVLNHARDRIEGTYDLYNYLDEKRSALDNWAAHLKTLLRSAASRVASDSAPLQHVGPVVPPRR